MKMVLAIGQSGQARARCWTVDNVTGKRSRKTRWTKNLMFDQGLNRIANQAANGYQGVMHSCVVGSSNAANSFQGGSITFSQSGTTLTSSTGFFTSAMVGAIFKQGASGPSGSEVYITAFTNSSSVTVSAPQSLSAVSGTVWMVQQTALTSFSYSSATYVTGSGNCGTTYSSSTAALMRTYKFATQSSSYNVNEVGYADNNQSSSACNGRIVLGATVVVPTTSFLVVQIELTFTQSPASPISVSDVSGGTFNTSGTAMLQTWAISAIDVNGNNTQLNGAAFVDSTQGVNFSGVFNTVSTVSLNTGILTSFVTTSPVPGISFSFGQPSNTIAAGPNSGANYAIATSNSSFSTTATAATCYSIIFGLNNGGNYNTLFAINLTTPVAISAGTFQGTAQFQCQYSRTLTN